jgi:hypothetical protein
LAPDLVRPVIHEGLSRFEEGLIPICLGFQGGFFIFLCEPSTKPWFFPGFTHQISSFVPGKFPFPTILGKIEDFEPKKVGKPSDMRNATKRWLAWLGWLTNVEMQHQRNSRVARHIGLQLQKYLPEDS